MSDEYTIHKSFIEKRPKKRELKALWSMHEKNMGEMLYVECGFSLRYTKREEDNKK